MDKLSMIKDYIRYLLKARTKHSIHSPFVFEFVTKVLEQKKLSSLRSDEIEKVRAKLLASDKEINVLDFGANSENFLTYKRKVSDIVRISSKNRKYTRFLSRIISFYQSQNILELGTSAGISSMYMATAVPNVKLTTIEGCPETASLAKENFEILSINNIVQYIGNIDKILPEMMNKDIYFDFIYFDANHTEEATIRYFKQCLTSVNNESIFVFDDINWSAGMKKAWGFIINHPSVTVSIDLFFMGIVFFKKELSKEHFIIRYL